MIIFRGYPYLRVNKFSVPAFDRQAVLFVGRSFNPSYYLSIYSSRRESHTVSFNSSSPNIIAIYWSDYDFTVKTGDAARPKADFKVLSPAE